MNGVKLLLDTNFIIGLVKGNVQVANLLQDRSINLEQCAYSFITRIELLSYPTITDAEVRAITSILNAMRSSVGLWRRLRNCSRIWMMGLLH